MCMWKITVRGVRIAGRQLYLTDAGVRLGSRGPLVSLESLLLELSLPMAQFVADSVEAIREKINSGRIDVNRYAVRSPIVPNTPEDNPWYREENLSVSGTAIAASVADYYGNMPVDTAVYLHEQEEEEDELTQAENDPVTGYREPTDCTF